MAHEELDYDYKDHTAQAADANLAVKFYIDAIEDEAASVEAGRPKFLDMEMIEIRVRGQKDNIVQRPSRPDGRKRFRSAYQAFKDDAAEVHNGTPVKEWPPVTKSSVLELRHMGFHTVEQLAEASDEVCSKMAGLQMFKQKAKAYIELSSGTAVIGQMQQKLAAEVNEKEVLQRNLAGALARIEALEAASEQTAAKRSKIAA